MKKKRTGYDRRWLRILRTEETNTRMIRYEDRDQYGIIRYVIQNGNKSTACIHVRSILYNQRALATICLKGY